MTSARSAGRRRPLAALSMAALLLITACSDAGEAPEQDTASAAPSSSQESSAPAEQEGGEAESSDVPLAEQGSGQGDTAALESMSLSLAEDGSASIEADTPISAEEVSTRVLTSGDGEQVQDGELITVATVAADPETGQTQDENFSTGPESIIVSPALNQANPVLYSMLRGNAPGAEIGFYLPAQTQPAGEGSEDTVGVPAQMLLFKIMDKLPLHAQGEEVDDVDPALPEVTVDEATQEPTIAAPEGDAPSELVVQPLIEGEGETVGEQDRVTVQYTGVTWSEGEVFDSSWERDTPAQFALQSVIDGWTEGLAGQKVGSRVLLAIPADKAYGEQGSPPNIGPDEPLVFVVDILHSQKPMQPAGE